MKTCPFSQRKPAADALRLTPSGCKVSGIGRRAAAPADGGENGKSRAVSKWPCVIPGAGRREGEAPAELPSRLPSCCAARQEPRPPRIVRGNLRSRLELGLPFRPHPQAGFFEDHGGVGSHATGEPHARPDHRIVADARCCRRARWRWRRSPRGLRSSDGVSVPRTRLPSASVAKQGARASRPDRA